MYQVGDKVIYGAHGACEIVAMEKRLIERKTTTYLVLEPIGQAGCRYLVPTHSEAAMAKVKQLLSPENLSALFDGKKGLASNWIEEESQRKLYYREIMNNADRIGLVGMLHTLYRRKKARADTGKKLRSCDDNFLHDAEKLLGSEVSVVLGVSQDAAREYIRKKLQ